MIETEAVAGGFVHVERADGIIEAAGGMDDGQCAIQGSGHLRQTAGLEQGGHEHKIRAGVGEAREAFVEIDHGHPVVQAEFLDDVMEVLFVRAVGDDDHLQVAKPIIGDELM